MAKAATAAMDSEQGLGGKLKAFPERTKSFMQDVRTEMKHVSYPSRKEVQGTTIVVLITVALFGMFFYIVDLIFSRAVDFIFHRFA